MAKFPRLAVVTIEGGGAFGFSLLGQLQAAIEWGVIPVALAGTSAGAIIATLHWAGYTPKEIKEKFCELADTKQITAQMGPFQTGDSKAFTFESFVSLKDEFESLLTQAEKAFSSGSARCNCLSLLRKAADTGRQLRPHLKNRGLFQGEVLVETLDRWLRTAPHLEGKARESFERGSPVEKITFGQFAEATRAKPRPPLFLPVTNVTKRKLELVCSMDPAYANWSIARAVRASAGFPAFFQPVSFGHVPEESYYVDGGVIANYPAWIFGHQFREALYKIDSGREFAIRPWVHIGLCLGAPAGARDDGDRAKTPKSFVTNFARLLGGGARQELELQLVSLLARSIEIRQPEDETDAPQSLLDFGKCDRQRISLMYRRGRQAAKEKLQEYTTEHPPADAVHTILDSLVQKSLLALGQIDANGVPTNSRLQLRANVFMPIGEGGENWKIAYSHNMDGDPDADLELPKFAGLTGMCVGLRRPLICNLEKVRKAAENGLDTGKLFGMTRAMHVAVRPDRTWLVSVPVYDRYAEYPTRIGDDVRKFDGRFHREIGSDHDGAVLAVLNLDGSIPFKELGLDENPDIHWTNVRIQTIMDLMRSAASDLGLMFSVAYCGRRGA